MSLLQTVVSGGGAAGGGAAAGAGAGAGAAGAGTGLVTAGTGLGRNKDVGYISSLFYHCQEQELEHLELWGLEELSE